MLSIARIVVPTDFSPGADRALDHALVLARRFGAEVDLVHAVLLPQPPGDPQGAFPGEAELAGHLSRVAEEALAELATRRPGPPVTLRREVRQGYSARVILLRYVEEVDADLIVMGTHGRTGIDRLLLGSVAEQVVRHAACPVLTVGEAAQGLEAVDHILVPVDLSPEAASGLAVARDLAVAYAADLQLLHVVELPPEPYFYGMTSGAGIAERLQERARRDLEELAGAELGATVRWQATVTVGRASDEIIRFAEARNCGLVVISAPDLSGLERVLLGSTAQRVLRAAPCPVLTLKPAGRLPLEDSISSPQHGVADLDEQAE